MSTTKTPLLPGNWYHIYNRGINGEQLFYSSDNYQYFLRKMKEHLVVSIELYSYCLLPNHFHLLVRIKEDSDKSAAQCISNLCNAYTQALNRQINRHGSLFERPFRRKLISSERYQRQLILYIHSNPKHHNVMHEFDKYPHSSYQSILSQKPTNLMRGEILTMFDSRNDFIKLHQLGLENEIVNQFMVEHDWQ